jgi:hypothetical protein
MSAQKRETTLQRPEKEQNEMTREQNVHLAPYQDYSSD